MLASTRLSVMSSRPRMFQASTPSAWKASRSDGSGRRLATNHPGPPAHDRPSPQLDQPRIWCGSPRNGPTSAACPWPPCRFAGTPPPCGRRISNIGSGRVSEIADGRASRHIRLALSPSHSGNSWCKYLISSGEAQHSVLTEVIHVIQPGVEFQFQLLLGSLLFALLADGRVKPRSKVCSNNPVIMADQGVGDKSRLLLK